MGGFWKKLKMIHKTKLIRGAISLSQSNNKDFTEVELLKRLGIESQVLRENLSKDDIKKYFYVYNRTKGKCYYCNSQIEIDSGLKFTLCPNCNKEISIEREGLLRMGIKNQEVVEFLISHLESALNQEGWKIRDEDNGFIIFKKDEKLIAFSIRLEDTGIKEYFTLRGWSSDYDPQTYILVSPSFDSFVSTFTSKDLKCCLMNIDSIFNKESIKELLRDIKKRGSRYGRTKSDTLEVKSNKRR